MALYKVNRRIVLNGSAYNPGSEIELIDSQAAQMKNGQVTAVPVAASPVVPAKPVMPTKPVEPAPVEPSAGPTKLETAVEAAKQSLDAAETAIAEVETQAASQETGTDETTAPVK